MRRLLAACLLLSGLAHAAPGPGADAKLELAKGTVLVLKHGTRRYAPAQAGTALKYGDEVRTLADSIAHVSFSNGATILVKERSTFSIGGSPDRTFLSFATGEFLIGLRRKLTKRQSFRVRTPAAVAAVRGTLFWGKSDEKNDSHYACFVERIEITAQGRTVTLEGAQRLDIPYGQPPSEPRPSDIPIRYVDTFSVDGSLQGLDDLLKR